MIISLFGLKKFTVRFKVSSEFLHIFINVIFIRRCWNTFGLSVKDIDIKRSYPYKSFWCCFFVLLVFLSSILFSWVVFFCCCWKLMRSNCRIESAYFAAFIRRAHMYPRMAKFLRKEGRTLWTAHTEVTSRPSNLLFGQSCDLTKNFN